ncbi:MAG: helix-turn-helix transcriptional regulator [Elusimicrobia bacterium]|nr:helix-turn-helix transcriptional regulator [Elusimicrobiota bacterium]MDE2312798.1 helix-turn-helix transcriptional regulator [Elusimicrobiota bacterium]
MAERGLGLRALCRAVGLDASFFSKVLSGKRSPPGEDAVLRSLAAVLGVDPVRLILSTGRLPAEMESLWREPDLGAFAAQHRPAPRPSAWALRAASAPAPRPPAAPPHPQISEELL